MAIDKLDVAALETRLRSERAKVDVGVLNFSVRELVRMMLDGEMNISPEYQRKFRWHEDNEALFVESVFLGLPVPPLFVATNSDFRWEVVDGLQRLSTLVHFTAESDDLPNLIHREANLRLRNLEKIPELNGLTYAEIPPPLRMYFGRQPLQVVSLTDKSDREVRFDLFERLNGGSIALSPQEVRACVYRGKANEFIERLSEQEYFTRLLKLQQSKQHDGTQAEQVLKFFAYKNGREAFDGRVRHFLNEYMGEMEEGGFDFRLEEELFERSCAELYRACGEQAYLRSDYAVTPLVQLEGSLVGMAEILQSGQTVGSPPAGWTDDQQLKAASMGGSNSRPQLERRIERAKELLGAQ